MTTNDTNEVLSKRRKKILRHIDNVNKSCQILGERLIERGEVDLGHNLIANGLCHDNSKFYGVEWKYLHDDADKDKFQDALFHHTTLNKHHPEAWSGGIQEMNRLYVAEMVCDWQARASEFGIDLRVWIREKATKRYHMAPQSKVYHKITDFVNLLLDQAF